VSKSTVDVSNQYGEKSNNNILGGSSRVWCKFQVLNSAATGVANLTGSLFGAAMDVASVFMHSTAPGGGNPNPAAGYVVIKFSRAFAGLKSYLANLQMIIGSPVNVSGALTVGTTYTIVSVGTTTAAQWASIGLTAGLTPAVGQTFVATSATPAGGTGTVAVSTTSGCDHFESVGDPGSGLNVTGGGEMVIASVNEDAVTALANGTTVTLHFDLIAAPGPQI
jgi:hypothetical protein